MATATIEIPHVYTALGKILKYMEVAKTGQLPSNLGGKAYIPAPAISEEVKRQFVANDLILLSNEVMTGQESVLNNNRMVIRVVVTGHYDIVSLVDASKVTISGTGDGLANATAVAANIASTNAQKNALLRTLLISEESVEKASHTEATQDTPTGRKLDKARDAKPVTKTATKPAVSKTGEASARDTVRIEWIEKGKADKDSVNSLVASVKAENDKLKGDDIFAAVLARLENGEVG